MSNDLKLKSEPVLFCYLQFFKLFSSGLADLIPISVGGFPIPLFLRDLADGFLSCPLGESINTSPFFVSQSSKFFDSGDPSRTSTFLFFYRSSYLHLIATYFYKSIDFKYLHQLFFIPLILYSRINSSKIVSY